MSRVRIRSLRRPEREDILRLIAGYVSREAYAVRKTETRDRVRFHLERVSLDRPFRRRFPTPTAELARYLRVLKKGTSLGAYDSDRLVGIVVAERRPWNRSAWAWELGVAETHRRR